MWLLLLCWLIVTFILQKKNDSLFEDAFKEALKQHPEGKEKIIRTSAKIIEAANEEAA